VGGRTWLDSVPHVCLVGSRQRVDEVARAEVETVAFSSSRSNGRRGGEELRWPGLGKGRNPLKTKQGLARQGRLSFGLLLTTPPDLRSRNWHGTARGNDLFEIYGAIASPRGRARGSLQHSAPRLVEGLKLLSARLVPATTGKSKKMQRAKWARPGWTDSLIALSLLAARFETCASRGAGCRSSSRCTQPQRRHEASYGVRCGVTTCRGSVVLLQSNSISATSRVSCLCPLPPRQHTRRASIANLSANQAEPVTGVCGPLRSCLPLWLPSCAAVCIHRND
jgi:hypothetical protein